jgi:hypothetical protein
LYKSSIFDSIVVVTICGPAAQIYELRSYDSSASSSRS